MERDEYIEVNTVGHKSGGQIGYVTVDNQTKMNALSTEGRRKLSAAMRELAKNDQLRAVVLTGKGEQAFIGGANLGEMEEFDPAVAEAGVETTHFVCDSIRRVPVPVIARISGYCLGAGMEIAGSCDFRISADTSVFGMPEVRYGLVCGMEACLLPQLIGWGKTRELMFTAAKIDAQEAYRIGFVEKLVALTDLDRETDRAIDNICRAGPKAIRLQKRLISDWEQMAISDAVQAGIRALGAAFRTDEPKQLIDAFKRQKKERKPIVS